MAKATTDDPGIEGILRASVATRRNFAAVASALLAVAAVGSAAVTITYNVPSTVSLTLSTPPVVWEAGPDSVDSDFVSSFTVSSNGTYFTVTLKPVPEANVTWQNLTSLKNQGSSAKNVTVNATSVSSSTKILVYAIEFRHHGNDTVAGLLDVKATDPSVNLGSMGAGHRVYARTYIKLDTGTSQQDLPSNVQISLDIS